MLRNINQPKLCNGTRLSVKKLMANIIEATILTEPFKGEDVLISRIPMIPTDMSFLFKRLQFPIRLASAITINLSKKRYTLKILGYWVIQLHLKNILISQNEKNVKINVSISFMKLNCL